MAEAVPFYGNNVVYKAPSGRGDVSDLHAFGNGAAIVSAWKLSPEELDEVNRTGCVFLSSLSGTTLYPVFVGSESAVRRMVADYGKVWEREPRPGMCSRPGCAGDGSHFPVILIPGPPERPEPFRLEIPRLLCAEHQAAFQPQDFMSPGAREGMRGMIAGWGFETPSDAEFDAAQVHWESRLSPLWQEMESGHARLKAPEVPHAR